MDLHIYGHNMEITDKAREHVESKLDQIDRHLPGISGATVEIAHEATRSINDRIVAQVTLNIAGTLLRAQRRGANTETAVNSVAQALDQQIKRYKSHAYRSKRKRQAERGAFRDSTEKYADTAGLEENPVDIQDTSDGEFINGEVVRVKEFDMEPMSVDEAAIQMQFLGHSFYMFLDSESDKHGVLYLRGDGNYGLIQPKTA